LFTSVSKACSMPSFDAANTVPRRGLAGSGNCAARQLLPVPSVQALKAA
jgi:hypothetical protein